MPKEIPNHDFMLLLFIPTIAFNTNLLTRREKNREISDNNFSIDAFNLKKNERNRIQKSIQCDFKRLKCDTI